MIWRAVLMKKEEIRQRIKSFGSFLVILILFPYVLTVFVNGADMKVNWNRNRAYVKVREVVEDGKAQIKEVPWDEYFIGVVAHEIPKTGEKEFMKAQAVLTRTKLDQIIDTAKKEGKEAVFEEEYLNGEEIEKKQIESKDRSYYKKLREAVDETGNQVLFYEGNYAYVPFHRSSNKKTRSYEEVTGQADYPYLTAKECEPDKGAEDELQVQRFPYKDVQKKCQSFLVAVDEENAQKTYTIADFEILSYDSAGYVSELRIGETVCSGDQFRDAMSLPSSSFSLDEADGELEIRTMGNGHGLGMSQWTANEMAKEGKSYEEILQYFFEGTELMNIEIFTKME